MPYDWTQLDHIYGLPPGTLNAVMMQESGGNPQAINKTSGAQGLFQFMPATAQERHINPMDPNQAAMGAGHYLHDLMAMDKGNFDNALADYNWGHGNRMSQGMENAPDETKNYIKSIHHRMEQSAQQGTQPSLATNTTPAGGQKETGNASQGIDSYSSSSSPSDFSLKGATNLNTEQSNNQQQNLSKGASMIDPTLFNNLAAGLGPTAMAMQGQSNPLGAPVQGPIAPPPVTPTPMAPAPNGQPTGQPVPQGNPAQGLDQLAMAQAMQQGQQAPGAPANPAAKLPTQIGQQGGPTPLSNLLPALKEALGQHQNTNLSAHVSGAQPMGRERLVQMNPSIPQIPGVAMGSPAAALLARLMQQRQGF